MGPFCFGTTLDMLTHLNSLTQICDKIYWSPGDNLWALPLKISLTSPHSLHLFSHPSPGVWIWSHGSARRATPAHCHTVKKQAFESVASVTLSAVCLCQGAGRSWAVLMEKLLLLFPLFTALMWKAPPCYSCVLPRPGRPVIVRCALS